MKSVLSIATLIATLLLAGCLEEEESQFEKDTRAIDKYLSDNGIEAQIDDSGIRYVIHEPGTGANPEFSSTVNVTYSGRLFNGTYFDTNIEALAREHNLYSDQREYGPSDFKLSELILGWQIGIPLLKPGGKMTLYLPSEFGYGASGVGLIPPNSNLIFDIELIEVK